MDGERQDAYRGWILDRDGGNQGRKFKIFFINIMEKNYVKPRRTPYLEEGSRKKYSIQVMVTREEYEAIREQAKIHGLPLSAFCRSAILYRGQIPAVDFSL